jgi:hypothetical protein
MSALCSLRDSLRSVLSETAPDPVASGPYVQSRQVASRLVQQALTAADPVPAINLIVTILEISDPA